MRTVKVSDATREEVRAALDQGALREVVIYCDVCGLEMATDMIGDTATERFDGARDYLRANRGWISSDGQDVCPFCAAGVRMCVRTVHGACEHPGWPVTEEFIGVLPEDWDKYYAARTVALGEAS